MSDLATYLPSLLAAVAIVLVGWLCGREVAGRELDVLVKKLRSANKTEAS